MTNMELYLEKYCRKEECPAEVAETHAICREVAAYYENPSRYNVNKTTIAFGCGGAVPGGDCK